MGHRATNSSSYACNAAAHIATRTFRREHDAVNNTHADTDAEHSTNHESNDHATELDRNPTNYNDRSAHTDYHQSGRT